MKANRPPFIFTLIYILVFCISHRREIISFNHNFQIKMKQQHGILDSIVNIYQKYLEWYLNPKSMPQFNGMDNRTVWQHFELEEKISICGTSLNAMCLSWPIDVITNVGKFLYNIILNDIILKPDILKGHDFKCSIPAFYTLYRNKGHYLTEQVCILNNLFCKVLI